MYKKLPKEYCSVLTKLIATSTHEMDINGPYKYTILFTSSVQILNPLSTLLPVAMHDLHLSYKPYKAPQQHLLNSYYYLQALL